MQQERRQLGAILAIERSRQGSKRELFLLRDTPKFELAMGFHQWHSDASPLWSLPAGGRDTTNAGEERVEETVTRELQEELAEAQSQTGSTTDLEHSLKITEAQMLTQHREQLLLPYIVAQINFPKRLLNILAVTSLRIQFDALAAELQRELERAVTSGAARFMNPRHIVEPVVTETQLRVLALSEVVRIPTIAAIACWLLQDDAGAVDLQADENARVYKTAQATAIALQLSVQNGAWGADGYLAPALLNREDKTYLGITDK